MQRVATGLKRCRALIGGLVTTRREMNPTQIRRVASTSDIVIKALPSSRPVDLETGGQHLKAIFWPHYRSNPYQSLLYGCDGPNYTFEPGDIDQALKRVSETSSGKICVFHLHWLNALISSSESRSTAASKAADFLRRLSHFTGRGGKFIWTIHNVTSHDTPHAKLESEISRELSERASVLHVHGKAAIAEAEAVFPVDGSKIVIAEHGNYIGVYPRLNKPI